MTRTDNLNLELPSGQEPPDIEVINRNMEKIDNAAGNIITGVEVFEEV